MPRIQKIRPPAHPVRPPPHVALDGRADDGGELAGQLVLVFLGQGDRVVDACRQCGAVAQQKEQQIQHDAKTHHELQRVLSYVQRLGRNELAGLHCEGRQFLLHVAQVVRLKRSSRPATQAGRAGNDLLQILAKVQLAGFQAVVNAGGFLGQVHGRSVPWAK